MVVADLKNAVTSLFFQVVVAVLKKCCHILVEISNAFQKVPKPKGVVVIWTKEEGKNYLGLNFKRSWQILKRLSHPYLKSKAFKKVFYDSK